MKEKRIINEKALVSLIKHSCRRIVNVFDDHFQFCNGYILVNLDYENYSVIQELFKKGALTDYRKFIPTESFDLSKFNTAENEVDAKRTGFIKEDGRYTARVFEIEGKFYLYEKSPVEVFQDAVFKARYDEGTKLFELRVYDEDKFLGLILPIRNEGGEKYTESVLRGLQEGLI